MVLKRALKTESKNKKPQQIPFAVGAFRQVVLCHFGLFCFADRLKRVR